MDQSKNQVFISYVEEDRKDAVKLYHDLSKAGVKPWLDKLDLRPGEKWKEVIRRELTKSSYVLVLLSSHSISKRGEFQREIRMAFDILDEFPPDKDIFIVPARLDDCKPNDEKLKEIHWVDLFPSESSYTEGFQRLLEVFRDILNPHIHFVNYPKQILPNKQSTSPSADRRVDNNNSNSLASAPPDLSVEFVTEDDEFNQIGDVWFNTSIPHKGISRSQAFVSQEGQKFIGRIARIGADSFDVEISGFARVTIPRPSAELEICEPELNDKLALQVRNGQPMLETMAQSFPINGIEYYYGETVSFCPKYYDFTIGLVVGFVNNDVKAFARLLGTDGDIIVERVQNMSPGYEPNNGVPLPGIPISLAVVESIYCEGQWCLFLSSELQRRRDSVIRDTSDSHKTQQQQLSYMFDYLEYQSILSCKVGAVYARKAIVNVEKIKASGEKINKFPISLNQVMIEGDEIDLENFGVIRTRGQLSLFLKTQPTVDISSHLCCEALLINKIGNRYCLSIEVDIQGQKRKIPLTIPESYFSEIAPFETILPFFSYVSVTNVVWNDEIGGFTGMLVDVEPEKLNVPSKTPGWIWYYSNVGPKGHIWAVNPSCGIWRPLYPYNHLLKKMGIRVHNPKLLNQCVHQFKNKSGFKAEMHSYYVGLRNKGNIVHIDDLYKLEASLASVKRSSQQSIFMIEQKGELLEGQIVDIDNEYVYVRITPNISGIIPVYEFSDIENYLIGDMIDIFLHYETNEQNQRILSRSIAECLLKWREIRKLHENKEMVYGTIVGRLNGGLEIDIMGFSAFMPSSLIGEDFQYENHITIRNGIECKIIELNPNHNRKHPIIVSRRDASKEIRKNNRKARLSELQVGQTFTGTVTQIKQYGVFIDVGGLDGLLHVSQMGWKSIADPAKYFSVGDETKVVIRSIDIKRNRIELGRKEILPNPWQNLEEKYSIGSVIAVKIIKFVNFGVFVELDENINGLLHNSEISVEKFFDHPSQVLPLNGVINVVVIRIEPERERIGLSIKQMATDPLSNLRQKYSIGTNVCARVSNIYSNGIEINLEEHLQGFVSEKHMKHVSVGEDIQAKVISNQPGLPVLLSLEDYFEEKGVGIISASVDKNKEFAVPLPKKTISSKDSPESSEESSHTRNPSTGENQTRIDLKKTNSTKIIIKATETPMLDNDGRSIDTKTFSHNEDEIFLPKLSLLHQEGELNDSTPQMHSEQFDLTNMAVDNEMSLQRDLSKSQDMFVPLPQKPRKNPDK